MYAQGFPTTRRASNAMLRLMRCCILKCKQTESQFQNVTCTGTNKGTRRCCRAGRRDHKNLIQRALAGNAEQALAGFVE